MVASMRRALVVGSGPAGYTAAIYLARAGLAPVVLEGSELGGALMSTGPVENFPGFDTPILGPELMARMRNQARNVGAELITEQAEAVKLAEGRLVIETGHRSFEAEAVVLAMGAQARMLGLPQESWAVGAGLATCAACDGFFYKGRPVAVVGGGDAALEDAIYLAEICPEVTVVHRRGSFRATRVLQERAASMGVRFQTHSVVTAILGDGSVSGIEVKDVRTGAKHGLDVAALFVAIGQSPRTGLVAGQVELSASGHVLIDRATSMTSVPGVFACGDLVDAHYRQAVTAAASGCAAALDAQRWLATRSVGTGRGAA